MKKKLGIILLALVLIQFSVVNVNGQDPRFPRPRFKDLTPEELQELEERMQNYLMGKTVISIINSLMMGYIMWFYYVMYMENRSKFSLGLIALSAALLVYSVASNPWILSMFARNGKNLMGLFNFIPDLFTTVAAAIMIYLTRT
jgi:predicted PurR-regulated permease PerM